MFVGDVDECALYPLDLVLELFHLVVVVVDRPHPEPDLPQRHCLCLSDLGLPNLGACLCLPGHPPLCFLLFLLVQYFLQGRDDFRCPGLTMHFVRCHLFSIGVLEAGAIEGRVWGL